MDFGICLCGLDVFGQKSRPGRETFGKNGTEAPSTFGWAGPGKRKAFGRNGSQGSGGFRVKRSLSGECFGSLARKASGVSLGARAMDPASAHLTSFPFFQDRI